MCGSKKSVVPTVFFHEIHGDELQILYSTTWMNCVQTGANVECSILPELQDFGAASSPLRISPSRESEEGALQPMLGFSLVQIVLVWFYMI